MINKTTEYEFSSTQNHHFRRLGNKFKFTAALLIIFSLENFIVILLHKPEFHENNPLYMTLSSLVVISTFVSAIWLIQAAIRYQLIVSSEGKDISLLESSNKKLQRAFSGISIAVIALCIRDVAEIIAIKGLSY